MRFAGQRMPRARMEQIRAPRAGYAERDFEYRDGLSITGEGPFPSISPGMPDTGLPDPLAQVMTQAPKYLEKVSIPTRIGNLG
jgi:hypothetical protein